MILSLDYEIEEIVHNNELLNELRLCVINAAWNLKACKNTAVFTPNSLHYISPSDPSSALLYTLL